MYQIKLNGMKFKAHIGVMPEEKVVGQNLEIDLCVETNFDFSGQDKLEDTLSYVDFYEQTKLIIDQSSADLIETLAYQIIEKVKACDLRIASVEVHLRKLAVPIDGIFDSAEVVMKG